MKQKESCQDSLYIILKTDDILNSFLEGISFVVKYYNLSFRDDYMKDFRRCIISLRSCYERLPSHEHREEWKSAFKKHKSIIAKLTTELVGLSKIDGISNPIRSVSRSKIMFSNGHEIEEADIVPRSFWPAYKLLRYAEYTKTSVELVVLMRVINTLFTMCKDFSLSPEEKDKDVLNQIFEIENTDLEDTADQIWSDRIEETLQLITKVMTGELASSGLMELDLFARAVSRARTSFNRTISIEDLKLSAASTGGSVDGRTIPGMLASVFERISTDLFDYSEFDRLVGYSPSLPLSPIQEMKFSRNNCVAIEANKDSMRLIHTLANCYHDRLVIFEKMRKNILRNYRFDCTFEQSRGRDLILQWMRDPRVDSIYSLDLHACSNTLSRRWQKRVTQYMIAWMGYSANENNIMTEVWDRIMSFDTEIRLPSSREKVKFSFKSGQAMGFTDSFFSFAMLHHIAVLTVLRYSKAVSKGYCIVGDDFSNAMQGDTEMEFPTLYKSCMAFLNTECNIEKGYIYNKHIPEYQTRIAEFCKFLVCDGVDITPYPLGLVTQSVNLMGRLSLLGWELSHTKMRIEFETLLQSLNCGNKTSIALDLMRKLPFNNLVNSVNGPFNMKIIYDVDEAPIIFCAAISFIRQSVLLTTLIEMNRDPNYIPKFSDESSVYYYKLKKEFRRLKDLNLPYEVKKNQKFLNWLVNLETLAVAQGLAVENILKGLLPDSDIIELLPSLNSMEERDIEHIVSLSAFLDSVYNSESSEMNQLYWGDTLDREFVLNKLMSIERLISYDVNSTNHRFGSSSDRRNIGFDCERFVEDTFQLLESLFVDHQEIRDNYCRKYSNWDDIPYQNREEFWESTFITVSQNEDTDEDEYDPWALL